MLKAKQLKAIQALALGKTDQAAADESGVTRRTIVSWRQEDEEFRAELSRLMNDQRDRIAARLGALAENSALVIRDAMQALGSDGTVSHSTRLRAAETVLNAYTKIAAKQEKVQPGPTGPLLSFPAGTSIALVSKTPGGEVSSSPPPSPPHSVSLLIEATDITPDMEAHTDAD